MCLELYQDCKDLGRFMLRSGGNTIAAGVVTKVGKSVSICVSWGVGDLVRLPEQITVN